MLLLCMYHAFESLNFYKSNYITNSEENADNVMKIFKKKFLSRQIILSDLKLLIILITCRQVLK